MKRMCWRVGIVLVLICCSLSAVGAQDLAAINAIPGIQPGSILVLTLTGNISGGSVWGTGTYTSDSNLAAAAVHAGVLSNRAQGKVIIEVLPGGASYRGTSANGVNSASWGAYGLGFRFLNSMPVGPGGPGGPSGPSGSVGPGSQVGPGTPGPHSFQTISPPAYSAPIMVYGFEDSTALTRIRPVPGAAYYFRLTGSTNGRVWGTGTYTLDSTLEAAVVHAGLLSTGQTGIVKVLVLPGRSSYEGSSRNGVSSSNYGSYGASYSLESVAGNAQFSKVLSDPGTVAAIPGASVGNSFVVWLVGNAAGSTIWGTGVYTSDSALSKAAVHAGILRDGEAGPVVVRILPGQSSYSGTTSNGVSSSGYGGYGLSYSLEPVR